MYRRSEGELQVFLVHPGGPFWAKKNKGAWSIPKGEYEGAEPALEAAVREFQEETGFDANGAFLDLGAVRQAGGKVVSAWGFEGDCIAADLTSNLCRMEWPPRSGRQLEFPEIDRGCWFSLPDAGDHILESQKPFLQRLATAMD